MNDRQDSDSRTVRPGQPVTYHEGTVPFESRILKVDSSTFGLRFLGRRISVGDVTVVQDPDSSLAINVSGITLTVPAANRHDLLDALHRLLANETDPPQAGPFIEVYKPGAVNSVAIEVLPGRVEPCPQCQQLLGYHFPVVLFATRQETAWRVRLVCPVGGQRYVLPHDFGPVGDSKVRT